MSSVWAAAARATDSATHRDAAFHLTGGARRLSAGSYFSGAVHCRLVSGLGSGQGSSAEAAVVGRTNGFVSCSLATITVGPWGHGLSRVVYGPILALPSSDLRISERLR
jgi:hypothetical protein